MQISISNKTSKVLKTLEVSVDDYNP